MAKYLYPEYKELLQFNNKKKHFLKVKICENEPYERKYRNKHLIISLVIKELQIKTTKKYNFTLTRIT